MWIIKCKSTKTKNDETRYKNVYCCQYLFATLFATYLLLRIVANKNHRFKAKAAICYIVFLHNGQSSVHWFNSARTHQALCFGKGYQCAQKAVRKDTRNTKWGIT